MVTICTSSLEKKRVTLYFYLWVWYDSHYNQRLFPYGVNYLIVVMVKCVVLFEVRTGFLNNI
jgi:hypothetical protein